MWKQAQFLPPHLFLLATDCHLLLDSLFMFSHNFLKCFRLAHFVCSYCRYHFFFNCKRVIYYVEYHQWQCRLCGSFLRYQLPDTEWQSNLLFAPRSVWILPSPLLIYCLIPPEPTEICPRLGGGVVGKPQASSIVRPLLTAVGDQTTDLWCMWIGGELLLIGAAWERGGRTLRPQLWPVCLA